MKQYFDRKDKGVSPLIAVVILLALVVSIAVLLSGFFFDITERTGEDADERLSETIDCNHANLDAELDIEEPDTSGDNVSLWVENIGSEHIYGLTMFVQIENDDLIDIVQYDSDEVEPNNISSPGIEKVTSYGNPKNDYDDVNITQIEVSSELCQSLSAVAEWNELTGSWE